MKRVSTFWTDEDGGPAAEFALVLPLALLFLFGIIDVGRFMWEYNRAEKATQMGARFAAVTDMVPATLATTNFVSSTVLQGDPVPSASFSGTSCNNVSPCTNSWGYNPTAFTNIVQRMRAIKPDITAAKVIVDYNNSNLGFAGDPNGPDVAPLITVRLRNMTFRPITTQIFNVSVAMPDFSYSLTMEDGVGAASN